MLNALQLLQLTILFSLVNLLLIMTFYDCLPYNNEMKIRWQLYNEENMIQRSSTNNKFCRAAHFLHSFECIHMIVRKHLWKGFKRMIVASTTQTSSSKKRKLFTSKNININCRCLMKVYVQSTESKLGQHTTNLSF